jgi:hypothetical protein
LALFFDPGGVVAALRADRVLSAPLRQAALRAVLRRAQPAEAATGTCTTRPETEDGRRTGRLHRTAPSLFE